MLALPIWLPFTAAFSSFSQYRRPPNIYVDIQLFIQLAMVIINARCFEVHLPSKTSHSSLEKGHIHSFTFRYTHDDTTLPIYYGSKWLKICWFTHACCFTAFLMWWITKYLITIYQKHIVYLNTLQWSSSSWLSLSTYLPSRRINCCKMDAFSSRSGHSKSNASSGIPDWTDLFPTLTVESTRPSEIRLYVTHSIFNSIIRESVTFLLTYRNYHDKLRT